MTVRTTIARVRAKRRKGEPVTMLTAYDYPTARLVDAAGVDIVLVGDSLAMEELGHETTLPLAMDEMLHHVKAVRRGTERALLVADMPFLSYQVNDDEAVRNAGRLLQEGGAGAVKLEGGQAVAPLTTATAATASVVDILNYALLLEYLEKTFYDINVARFYP